MHTLIIILSILSILGTFIPKIESDYWLVAGQSYFKIAYLILNIIMFAVHSIWFNNSTIYPFISAGLLLAAIHCLVKIIPFTPFAKKRVKSAKSINETKSLRVFSFNVYQYNERYSELVDTVLKKNPDVVILMETNEKWEKGVSDLNNSYPFSIKEIKENTYGIMVFSKYEIINKAIKYQTNEDVPSIEFLVNKDDMTIRIFGLHPMPPVLGESETSTQKDKELMLTAQHIAGLDKSENILVLGDINDVVWSKTSRAFMKVSRLLEPRIGRGFYSTFPTFSFYKIPLDQVYCSENFELVSYEILDDIGSDHLPVFVHFQIK